MLENLNRIFGACFPPLVILGWLGAGIFLYTAFRSGKWRKKLTGAEGFLALLLLFMMANRIPNPAIISFRYLIGIGILTLFWSVWLLRWSWHNCPASLRRWRGMLLLALVFGICLGGFLKEIRLSKRTRRETEIIRFLQKSRLFSTEHSKRVLLGTTPRLERILITAAREREIEPLVIEDERGLLGNLKVTRYANQDIYVLLSKTQEEQYWPAAAMAAFPEDRWKRIGGGQWFGIYQIHQTKSLVGLPIPMPPYQKQHIIHENFEHGEIVDPANEQLQQLREKGVGFTRSPLLLPPGWLPDAGHGTYEPKPDQMELKLIPNGISGTSLFFSGQGSGTVFRTAYFPADRQYRGAFIFQGSPGCLLEIFAYLHGRDGKFIRSEKLKSLTGNSNRQLIWGEFDWKCSSQEVQTFRIAVHLAKGTILIDNFVLKELQ